MKDLAVTIVAIEQLEPNPWNPNVQSDFIFEKEKNSIKKFGFIDPITVREFLGNKLQIIDGEYRWKAAKELAIKQVPVINLGQVSDSVAKKLTLILNETKGEYDPFRAGQLIKGVLEHESMEEVVLDLPLKQDEIDNLLELTKFDLNAKEEVPWQPPEKKDMGSANQENWQELKFVVSEAQAAVINEAIERILKDEGIAGETARGRALELMAADFLASPVEVKE